MKATTYNIRGTKPLTDRQERFVHEYLIDQNASAAAARAGYSTRTKGTHAAQLMQSPVVKVRIAEELGALFARLRLSAFEVLRGQVRAAYLDPAKLFDAAREPIPLDELDEDTRGGLTVSYAQRRGGGYTLRVRQTPRHVALNILQKRLDAFEKLQAEALAGIEEEEAPPLARAAGADGAGQARGLFDIDLRLDAPQPPMNMANAEVALAEAAQALAPGGVAPTTAPVLLEKTAGATAAQAAALAPAEGVEMPPPSPFEPGYDFRKDPDAMYGGRFTAWNRYWKEKREREQAAAEEAAALANPPPNMRIGPGKVVPVRMELGYNPPWLRSDRPEFAIGAGECWID